MTVASLVMSDEPNKFPIVHLVKKKDNTLFFMDKYKGEIKSIEIPPEE